MPYEAHDACGMQNFILQIVDWKISCTGSIVCPSIWACVAQVVHMTEDLMMTAPNAEAAFHIFTAVCYLLPLIGAWLADTYFGKYAVVLYLSGFYCLGRARIALLAFKNHSEIVT